MATRFNRVHALTNTFSGVAGEARVAAELVRCGLRVAKPYWTDDEADLLVLERVENGVALPIPVQVKSVQFLPSKSRPAESDRFISGLKKRYVERNPALCLAIYRPDTDAIWFIHGAQRIRDVYERDVAASGKRVAYDDLTLADDVKLRMRFDGDATFDADWKVPSGDPTFLSERVREMAADLRDTDRAVLQLESLWTPDEPADEE